MKNLFDNGFLVFENVISKNSENIINYNIDNDVIDYKSVKDYIDSFMMPTIANKLNINYKIPYHKYRYSNNNNSTDASTFHNDNYNFSNMNIIPVYTCLSYFDEAKLELVPKSHIKKNRTWNKLMENYNNRIELLIPANSIIIFNSALFHRGKSFEKGKNRRLLQVFDCFINEDDFKNYSNRLISVQTNKLKFINGVSSLSKIISYNHTILESYVFIHFVLVYYNLQYKIILIDLPPYEKTGKFINYEAGKKMYYKDVNGMIPSNINIICNDWVKEYNPSNFYLFLFIFIILIIVFLKMRKNKKLRPKFKSRKK